MKNQAVKLAAFSAKDICEILAQCHLSGVRSLQLGSMKVVFANPAYDMPDSIPVPPDLRTAQTLREQEALVKDEITLREDEISRLMIEDPAKFEELMLTGELVDKQSGDGKLADD